ESFTFSFGLPPSNPCEQEPGDEHCFNNYSSDETDNVPLVQLPERGFSEPDDATWRKRLPSESPTLEFAPVYRHNPWRSFLWNLSRTLTTKHSQTHCCNSLPDPFKVEQVATGNPESHE